MLNSLARYCETENRFKVIRTGTDALSLTEVSILQNFQHLTSAACESANRMPYPPKIKQKFQLQHHFYNHAY